MRNSRFLNTVIGDRAFYRRVVSILVPIVIQNTLTNAVSLVDNVMVGSIGTLQMSAVAVVNQLLFVFNLCIFGGLSGAGIFTAQYAGSADRVGVRNTLRAKLYMALAMLLIGVSVFTLFPEPLITLYLAEDTSPADATATLMYGQQYLMIMLIGLLPFALSQSYGSTLRETGETKLPMLAGAAAIFINLVLNYVFIFGNTGLPFLPFEPMGVGGAAIATVISRYAEAVILIVAVHRKKKKYSFVKGLYSSPKIPRELVIGIAKKGLPLLANECLWSVGMAVILQCYSVRGLDVVAAANIASTVGNLFNVVFLSMGNAIAIMIGHHLGAGEACEASRSVWRLITLSLATCAITGIALGACSGVIPLLYNTTTHVRGLATEMLIALAAVMPVHAFAHAVYFTLRSGGKTLMTFIFDCGFTWGLVIPFAALSANFTSLDIIALYTIVQFLDLAKCILGFFLIKKGVWINRIIPAEQ